MNGFESVETPNPFVAVSVVGTSGVEVELLCGAVVRAPADEAVLRCVFNALSSAAMDEADGASGGRRCTMLTVSGQLRVFVCTQPADMRRSFDGLCGMAEESHAAGSAQWASVFVSQSEP